MNEKLNELMLGKKGKRKEKKKRKNSNGERKANRMIIWK